MGFKSNKYMTSMKKSKGMLKTLSVATLAGVASMGVGVNDAYAAETSITPTLGDNASYTLTETADTTLNNVITKYVYDEESGSLNKEYYKYDLAKTEYGSGTNARYYKWVDGKMERISTDASGNPTETPELTFRYNSTGTQWRPNNQYVYGDYVEQTGAVLDGWGSTSSPFNCKGVEANFVDNASTWGGGHGAALRAFSMAKYGDITGTFIGNHSVASGGAIYNYAQYTYDPKDAYAEIGNITGDFIGNYVNDTTGDFMEHGGGGAIFNSGIDNTEFNVSIGNINGNFIRNYTTSSRFNQYGGAIQNMAAEIGDITGDFIENYNSVTVSNKSAKGGAIFNGAINDKKGSVIGNITGDFIGNYVSGYLDSAGGAIYNNYGAEIGNITGNFIQNYVYSPYKEPSGDNDLSGGAIYNNKSSIKDIKGSFLGNSVLSYSAYAQGGAIFNANGSIGNITGDFIENGASAYLWTNHLYTPNFYSGASGGAIYNDYASIGNIDGNFINNTVYTDYEAYGGAIYNNAGTIGNITGDFKGNLVDSYEYAYGGAIYNVSWDENTPAKIGNIKGDFVENSVTTSSYSQGGAICNELGEISSISGNFVGNTAKSVYVLDIDYSIPSNLGMAQGGAIYNFQGKIGALNNSIFIDNSATSEEGIAQGGAIYNDEGQIGSITNASFVNNYAKSDVSEAQGGAIYTTSDMSFVSDNGITEFTGNYVEFDGVKDDNAIYVNSVDATLNFELKNNGKVILNDNIDGLTVGFFSLRPVEEDVVQDNYNVNITGDKSGTFYLYNDIRNADLTISNTTINTLNDLVHNYNVNTLTVLGDTNLVVDVDLANNTMDRFTASEYGSHSGNLNVTGMNLLSDAVNDKTEILFAEQGLKDNVTNGITSQLPDNKYQTTLYTPIYKYDVSYDNREDAGYFIFTRPTAGGSTGGAPSVDTFNPAVLGSSTSATVGAVGTINQTLNHVFANSDTYMNIPYLERISMRDRNKYALSITGDATDMGRFSPLYQPSQEQSSVWVKPYATFETVGLKNGPKVHNNTYGTLVGFDSEMKSLKRGWDRVWTGYIGYNGASQRYSGIDSTQNGGLLGGTMTLYKGNFFNATTVSVGASVANNQTMYGNEDFAMLLSGIGNKTGYNFEFKEGKLILQPSMLMSYTFVNTFDYTNAAGVRIDNKPLHALQLAPGVKVIGNLKNGWQPYASIQMVWNLMGESHATANGVKLPEMSIKPYVQYGVGVQKRVKDHFTAYGQAMMQNGGRNGISLTAGLRWALGKDKAQKVEKNDSKILKQVQDDKVSSASGKKILKQMTPEQKMALGGGKYQNTSRTAKTGTLRQY